MRNDKQAENSSHALRKKIGYLRKHLGKRVAVKEWMTAK